MLSNIVTQNISLDTPIMMLTPRQLFEMERQWLSDNVEVVDSEAVPSGKRYARTMAELADALGTSVATCYRMKASGVLDDAVSQCNR